MSNDCRLGKVLYAKQCKYLNSKWQARARKQKLMNERFAELPVRITNDRITNYCQLLLPAAPDSLNYQLPNY
jgi:hypothetical protein